MSGEIREPTVDEFRACYELISDTEREKRIFLLSDKDGGLVDVNGDGNVDLIVWQTTYNLNANKPSQCNEKILPPTLWTGRAALAQSSYKTVPVNETVQEQPNPSVTFSNNYLGGGTQTVREGDLVLWQGDIWCRVDKIHAKAHGLTNIGEPFMSTDAWVSVTLIPVTDAKGVPVTDSQPRTVTVRPGNNQLSKIVTAVNLAETNMSAVSRSE